MNFSVNVKQLMLLATTVSLVSCGGRSSSPIAVAPIVESQPQLEASVDGSFTLSQPTGPVEAAGLLRIDVNSPDPLPETIKVDQVEFVALSVEVNSNFRSYVPKADDLFQALESIDQIMLPGVARAEVRAVLSTVEPEKIALIYQGNLTEVTFNDYVLMRAVADLPTNLRTAANIATQANTLYPTGAYDPSQMDPVMDQFNTDYTVGGQDPAPDLTDAAIVFAASLLRSELRTKANLALTVNDIMPSRNLQSEEISRIPGQGVGSPPSGNPGPITGQSNGGAPDNGLVVTIVNASEVDGKAYTVGDSFQITATATDEQGNDLSNQIQWVNRQGLPLGQGPTLTYNSGSEPDNETVTAQVTAADGRQNYARASFVISTPDVIVAPNVKVSSGTLLSDSAVEDYNSVAFWDQLFEGKLRLRDTPDLPVLKVGDVLIGEEAFVGKVPLIPLQITGLQDLGDVLDLTVTPATPDKIFIEADVSFELSNGLVAGNSQTLSNFSNSNRITAPESYCLQSPTISLPGPLPDYITPGFLPSCSIFIPLNALMGLDSMTFQPDLSSIDDIEILKDVSFEIDGDIGKFFSLYIESEDPTYADFNFTFEGLDFLLQGRLDWIIQNGFVMDGAYQAKYEFVEENLSIPKIGPKFANGIKLPVPGAPIPVWMAVVPSVDFEFSTQLAVAANQGLLGWSGIGGLDMNINILDGEALARDLELDELRIEPVTRGQLDLTGSWQTGLPLNVGFYLYNMIGPEVTLTPFIGGEVQVSPGAQFPGNIEFFEPSEDDSLVNIIPQSEILRLSVGYLKAIDVSISTGGQGSAKVISLNLTPITSVAEIPQEVLDRWEKVNSQFIEPLKAYFEDDPLNLGDLNNIDLGPVFEGPSASILDDFSIPGERYLVIYEIVNRLSPELGSRFVAGKIDQAIWLQDCQLVDGNYDITARVYFFLADPAVDDPVAEATHNITITEDSAGCEAPVTDGTKTLEFNEVQLNPAALKDQERRLKIRVGLTNNSSNLQASRTTITNQPPVAISIIPNQYGTVQEPVGQTDENGFFETNVTVTQEGKTAEFEICADYQGLQTCRTKKLQEAFDAAPDKRLVFEVIDRPKGQLGVTEPLTLRVRLTDASGSTIIDPNTGQQPPINLTLNGSQGVNLGTTSGTADGSGLFQTTVSLSELGNGATIEVLAESGGVSETLVIPLADRASMEISLLDLPSNPFIVEYEPGVTRPQVEGEWQRPDQQMDPYEIEVKLASETGQPVLVNGQQPPVQIRVLPGGGGSVSPAQGQTDGQGKFSFRATVDQPFEDLDITIEAEYAGQVQTLDLKTPQVCPAQPEAGATPEQILGLTAGLPSSPTVLGYELIRGNFLDPECGDPDILACLRPYPFDPAVHSLVPVPLTSFDYETGEAAVDLYDDGTLAASVYENFDSNDIPLEWNVYTYEVEQDTTTGSIVSITPELLISTAALPGTNFLKRENPDFDLFRFLIGPKGSYMDRSTGFNGDPGPDSIVYNGYLNGMLIDSAYYLRLNLDLVIDRPFATSFGDWGIARDEGYTNSLGTKKRSFNLEGKYSGLNVPSSHVPLDVSETGQVFACDTEPNGPPETASKAYIESCRVYGGGSSISIPNQYHPTTSYGSSGDFVDLVSAQIDMELNGLIQWKSDGEEITVCLDP